MRAERLTIVAVLSIFVIALAGLAIFLLVSPRDNSQTAAIGGPFHLVDDRGRPVSDQDLRGKPTAIYFGYTFCPEVCPTTLSDMAGWIKDLGGDADKINFVFVTVDPQRDTAKVMHEYVASFDPRIRGFTGTPQAVAQAAKAYRVYYQRVPLQGGNYAMDHSTSIYLMDTRGRYFDRIAYQEDPKSAVEKLRAILRAS
jgi:protein SCO1